MPPWEEWVIRGEKMWCTNASIADYIITLVRTGASGSRSLSMIIVPTDAPGLGIEVDEAAATRHPFKQEVLHSTTIRADDNAILDW